MLHGDQDMHVRSFATKSELVSYFSTEVDNQHVAFVTDPVLFNREVEMLSIQALPDDAVVMSCHTHCTEKPYCHDFPRLRHTHMAMALVRYVDDGHVESLVFAAHKIDPGCNGEGCQWINHVTERLVLKKNALVVDGLLV